MNGRISWIGINKCRLADSDKREMPDTAGKSERMKWRLIIIKGIVLLLIACNVYAQSATKYNVLFICVDDLRPNLGCYGDATAITPNIDALASKGILFERAYCQQALCGPSRASVMTGRRPDALRIYDGTVHFRETLPNVVTLPQYFKENGYYAVAFGKVYHAHPAQPDPVSWSVPETLLDIPKRDEYLLPTNRVRGFINPMEKGTATESVDAPDNAYQDGQVAQAAIEALEDIREPFFLAVGFKRSHLPFTAPKKYWDLYSRNSLPLPDTTRHNVAQQQAALRYDWQRNSGEMRGYTDIPSAGPVPIEKARELIHGYYACVSYVDAQVGRVLDQLANKNLTQNTIVIFWADHGYHLGEKGLWGKKDNTEVATRVPLIVVVPGQKPNLRTTALVELVDIYPTLADLCGLRIPQELDGKSMAPLLYNPQMPWKEAAYSQYPRANNTVMGYSVRTNTFRYNEFRNLEKGDILDSELYVVSQDPFEEHNLVHDSSYKKDLKKLRQLLKAGWPVAGH